MDEDKASGDETRGEKGEAGSDGLFQVGIEVDKAEGFLLQLRGDTAGKPAGDEDDVGVDRCEVGEHEGNAGVSKPLGLVVTEGDRFVREI